MPALKRALVIGLFFLTGAAMGHGSFADLMRGVDKVDWPIWGTGLAFVLWVATACYAICRISTARVLVCGVGIALIGAISGMGSGVPFYWWVVLLWSLVVVAVIMIVWHTLAEPRPVFRGNPSKIYGKTALENGARRGRSTQ